MRRSHSHSHFRAHYLIALAAVFINCASLEPLAASTCGNGVVDSATEDCDSFPETTCGKPADGSKACRYTCDRKQAGSCPVGWGCSVDGFCREATGSLANAGAPLSAGAAALIAGDFDGDGRVDIVGAPPYSSGGNSRVHYFDTNLSLATTTALSVPIRLPVIKDFNSDGIDDLGFSAATTTVGGFAALAGRGDRSFSPILFPAITLPKVLAKPTTISNTDRTVLPGFNRSCVVAVTQTNGGGRLQSFCGDSITGTQDLDVSSGGVAPDELVGSPRSGIVFRQFEQNDQTSASICGEIVSGYNQAGSQQGKISITSPCEVYNDAGTAAVRWIKSNAKPYNVDAPGKILEPVFVGDLSVPPDGFADIVVHTDTGYFIAKSTGVALGKWESFTYYGAVQREVPLAAADLNDDTGIDIVFPSGILFTKSAFGTGDAGGGAPTVSGVETSLLSPSRSGQVWNDARIGRFNGDKFPDILVAYKDSLDVELLGSAGNGLITTYVVRSDQAVRAIVDGDFDGDLIQDIAFLQSPRALDNPAGAGEIELVLAYGKASGGPETPNVIGRFANARAVDTLHDPQSSVDSISVMETIASKTAGELPTTSVTVIFGSGGRQAIAPLFMRDDDAKPPYLEKGIARKGKTRIWAPAVLAAGSLGTPGKIDVMAIATGLTIDFAAQPPEYILPFPTGVWLAPHDDNAVGGLTSFSEVQRITDIIGAVQAREDKQSLESVIVATIGDIDVPRNGIDEVINIAKSPGGATGVYVVRTGSGQPTPTLVATLPTLKITGSDPLELVDVNGDGAPDLVALTTLSDKRTVLTLLNDGKGGFSSTPIAIELPQAAASTTPSATTNGALTDEIPLGFSYIVTGASKDGKTPQTQVVIITEKRLFLAQMKADNTSFDVRDESVRLATDAKATTISTTTRLSAVVGGDFDGDGVQDVAVADSGSIRILRQTPRLK